MLLVCYKYNVSTGIRRLGEPDFGHFDLGLIDRIQMRLMDIFDINPFPNHINISALSAHPFTAVGVRPLNFNDTFVKKGQPDKRLNGDLRFLALKQGVTMPPLGVTTPEEKNMYNDFFLSNPQKKSQSAFNSLAELYLKKANGTTIFPKLPTTLRRYYERSNLNQSIEVAQKLFNGSYEDVLKQLASVTVPAPPAINANNRVDFSHSNDSGINNSKMLRETAIEKLPQPVPLINTPLQTAVMDSEVCQLYDRACSWDPFCKSNARACMGFKRNSCIFYGENGSLKNTIPSADIVEERIKERFLEKEREHKKGKREEKRVNKGSCNH